MPGECARHEHEQGVEEEQGRDRRDPVPTRCHAQQRTPHRDVVTTEGDGDEDGRERTAPRCCSDLGGTAPRVDGEGQGRNGEDGHGVQRQNCQHGAHGQRHTNETNDTPPLGDTEPPVLRAGRHDQLGGEGEGVIEHCAEKDSRHHQHDTQHTVTVVGAPRGSIESMVSAVLPPTSAQLAEAREIVSRHLSPTPTVSLSLRGRSVWAKLESLQPVGSFKVRGALVAVAKALEANARAAVITSSAGNHGLGVAYASTLLGARATVVVPENASALKVEKILAYPVELIQHGSSYDEAQAHALALADTRGEQYISPFNHTWVIAGQATIVDELVAQAPSLTHLVVPVGGGGLISGVLLGLADRGRSDIRVTGVQPANSAAMYHVLRGKLNAEVEHLDTIADGLAGGGDDGAATNDILAANQTPLVLVPEPILRAAVREALEVNGLVLEASAAIAYGAITHHLVDVEDETVGFVASGRNITPSLVRDILQEPLL